MSAQRNNYGLVLFILCTDWHYHHMVKRSPRSSLFRPADERQNISPLPTAEEPERIVFRNPSEKYYAQHRSIQILDAPYDQEEVLQTYDGDYDAISSVSDVIDHEYDYSTKSTNKTTRTVPDEDSVPATTNSDHMCSDDRDWKQKLLDQQQTSMTVCCERCYIQALRNLEMRLKSFQQQITNELQKTLIETKFREHTQKIDHSTSGCGCRISNNHYTNQIVQVQLNDHVSNYFKRTDSPRVECNSKKRYYGDNSDQQHSRKSVRINRRKNQSANRKSNHTN